MHRLDDYEKQATRFTMALLGAVLIVVAGVTAALMALLGTTA